MILPPPPPFSACQAALRAFSGAGFAAVLRALFALNFVFVLSGGVLESGSGKIINLHSVCRNNFYFTLELFYFYAQYEGKIKNEQPHQRKKRAPHDGSILQD